MNQTIPDSDPPLKRRSIQVILAMVAVITFAVHGWLFVKQRPSQDNETQRHVDKAVVQIDLNTAPARELALLPSVGPVLAERIIQDRKRYGPFESMDDLMRVHGIGQKRIDQISPYCVIGPTANSGSLMAFSDSTSP
ncbi:MAG: helix-hairpin-helix domain-containing protein [Pirellulaceae bacterium]|nr:helix-hairpin-helix domain-containing protein [Pirellulaceae bacterium]